MRLLGSVGDLGALPREEVVARMVKAVASKSTEF